MNPRRARVYAWALYDVGNSAFATVVMAGFFPIFFKEYWSGDLPATESTFWLGAANSVASLLILASAPLLGAMADGGGGRKRFLAAFTGLGVVATAALYLVPAGAWPVAAVLYTLAAIGFSGSMVFYDAMLLAVCRERHFDAVSALGYALGYLGGGLLFAFTVVMTLQPGWFGLAEEATAVRLAFLITAGWWAAFTLPLLRRVPEPMLGPRGGGIVAGLAELKTTLGRVGRLRPVVLFLAAYWFYIDGVDTIVRMAVDYGLAIGLETGDLILALLLTQAVGFPAALAFGRLGARLGPRRGIEIAIAVYLGVVVWATYLDSALEFYLLAAAVGLVQGGIQSLSRSLYARIIPRDRTAEFFGFYNMLGKFAAVLGPALMGGVGLVTGSPRAGMGVVALLFVVGWLLLRRVDEEAARRQARELEGRNDL
ncbi:MFS transporter, UMF1 family [Thiohalospira halophila DSM 15071]|uniref:MFS transporter, UMF1 family n=1 Tax=Thiohalospira halophila DSM 15071 TaxID=1123397 RepID=A0A1I1QBF7_9GAMM|nr:MFS transporter [Thiohalospira halophila]SFD19411.1 MFS transporter, UMF1 family [Thiohalospira halophila DSM 15071]